MKKLVMCGVTMGLLATGLPAMANLISNGSFEAGNFVNGFNTHGDPGIMQLNDGSTAINGWIVNGGGGGASGDIAWESTSLNTIGLYASDGDKFLDLTGYVNDLNNPHGGITVAATQTVNTIAGNQYLLTFDMGSSLFFSHNYDNKGGIGNPQITVTVNGTPNTYATTDGDVNAPDAPGKNMHWQSEGFIFTASGPQTSLSFLSTTAGNDDIIALDNVSLTLTSVPEASTIIAGALLLLPFGASALRSIRKNRAA